MILAAALEAAAAHGTLEFAECGSRISRADLHDRARRVATHLRELGAGPGCTIAIVGDTNLVTATSVEAVVLSGAAVTVVAVPRRGRPTDPGDAVVKHLRAVGADMVLVDRPYATMLGAADLPLHRLDDVHRRSTRDAWSPIGTATDNAIVQHSSGSTGAPSRIELSHAAVVTNVRAIAQRLEVDEDDTIVSWLPLFHDMGLVGMYALCLLSGASGLFADAASFVGSPRRWFEWIEAARGTITAAPQFAYSLATRVLPSMSTDLRSLRIAVNGAEPIDVRAMSDFCDAAAPSGLRRQAPLAAYGLAENCVAVTAARPGEGIQVERVDRGLLETIGSAVSPAAGDLGQDLAVVGTPVAGTTVRIGDDARADRAVGEVQVRGDSLMTRCVGAGADCDTFTDDGWLRTGDLGYLTDGRLVVVGRSKDVLIVRGRTIAPQLVERAAGSVPGVRRGNAIAFGVSSDGTEKVVVAVERTGAVDDDDISSTVRAAVLRATEVAVADVVVLEPGCIPKTTSGKLQRRLCRKHYLSGSL